MEGKKDYVISCIGHKNLNNIYKFDEDITRDEVKNYLAELSDKYNLKLLTKLEEGACALFVEEGFKLNISPTYILSKEQSNRVNIILKGRTDLPYGIVETENVDDYLVDECDEMLCLWDGDIRGTDEIYPTIKRLQGEDKTVTFF